MSELGDILRDSVSRLFGDLVTRDTLEAAEKDGVVEATREKIRRLVAAETFGERFVTKILGRELGL